jgi:hypothetical protein
MPAMMESRVLLKCLFLNLQIQSFEFINLAKKDASKRDQLYRIPKAF